MALQCCLRYTIAIKTAIKPYLRHIKRKAFIQRSRMNKGFTSGCGSQIRTDDLRVMSPTSYRAAPSRDIKRFRIFVFCFLLSTYIL